MSHLFALSVLLATPTAPAGGTAETPFLFRAAQSSPVVAKTLDIETGQWRDLWRFSLPTDADIRSVVFLGDRFLLLLRYPRDMRYLELDARTGRALAPLAPAPTDTQAILPAPSALYTVSLQGQLAPLVRHRASPPPRPPAWRVHLPTEAEGEEQDRTYPFAVLIRGGRYAVAGAEYVVIQDGPLLFSAFRLGSRPRELSVPEGEDSQVALSMGLGVAPIGQGVVAFNSAQLCFYRVGHTGLVPDGSASAGTIERLLPAADGETVYGMLGYGKNPTMVSIRREGSRYIRRNVCSFEVKSDFTDARLVDLGRHLALVMRFEVIRLRREPKGALTVVGRTELPTSAIYPRSVLHPSAHPRTEGATPA